MDITVTKVVHNPGIASMSLFVRNHGHVVIVSTLREVTWCYHVMCYHVIRQDCMVYNNRTVLYTIQLQDWL